VSHYKSRQHASAQAGEDIINQAKAAGRSLTPSERAELERCIKEAEDARDWPPSATRSPPCARA
jgi:hypothetical protein